MFDALPIIVEMAEDIASGHISAVTGILQKRSCLLVAFHVVERLSLLQPFTGMIAQILHPGSLFLRSLLGLETGSTHRFKFDGYDCLAARFDLAELLSLIGSVIGRGNHYVLAEFDPRSCRPSGIDMAFRLAVQLPVAGQVAHNQQCRGRRLGRWFLWKQDWSLILLRHQLHSSRRHECGQRPTSDLPVPHLILSCVL